MNMESNNKYISLDSTLVDKLMGRMVYATVEALGETLDIPEGYKGGLNLLTIDIKKAVLALPMLLTNLVAIRVVGTIWRVLNKREEAISLEELLYSWIRAMREVSSGSEDIPMTGIGSSIGLGLAMYEEVSGNKIDSRQDATERIIDLCISGKRNDIVINTINDVHQYKSFSFDDLSHGNRSFAFTLHFVPLLSTLIGLVKGQEEEERLDNPVYTFANTIYHTANPTNIINNTKNIGKSLESILRDCIKDPAINPPDEKGERYQVISGIAAFAAYQSIKCNNDCKEKCFDKEKAQAGIKKATGRNADITIKDIITELVEGEAFNMEEKE